MSNFQQLSSVGTNYSVILFTKMPPQNLFHQKSKIIVSCPKGLAPWFEEELKESGFNTTSNSHTWVGLDGDLMDCMRINYSTRIGHKVLFLLKDFIARDPKARSEEHTSELQS